MEKNEILRLIRTQLENNVSELNSSLDTYRTGSDMDEGDTKDPEDFSQQTESRDMLLLMQKQLDNANAQINRLESFRLKTSSTVEPGAVVETEKNLFFIGLSFSAFQADGKELIGISPESPAFAALKGKGEGDSFKLGDNTFTISRIS